MIIYIMIMKTVLNYSEIGKLVSLIKFCKTQKSLINVVKLIYYGYQCFI